MGRANALVVAMAMAVGGAAAAAEPGRLPADIVPTHYDLLVSPNPATFTFTGVVGIDVDVRTATDTAPLNQKGLTLDRASLDGAPVASISPDEANERVVLKFARPLSLGRHHLEIAYHGPIGRGTFGIFAMDYASPAGPRRVLATNFEPSGARMLLPCWDEPDRKASFTVSLDAPDDQMAVANMPVASTAPAPIAGWKRVTFAPTPPMASYLLFLTEGDYERVHADAGGVDVGVVVKRGDGARAALALQEARGLLRYYNSWFGIPYPLPKLDLVAAPGEITGGSMENWGAIFFSQEHLLFDPGTSTARDRQLVFLVVSHEMAHQWFGDLVTMGWWDNLWLNEGFARWMQTHAADALHPDWRTGLQAQGIYEDGKRLDAKPSTHPILQPVASPAQAMQAFDGITYDKGAAVIAMLEAYAGPDAFRDGVRRYMRAHAFGNTVDTDLWREVAATSAKPVQAIERTFVDQAGLPLVSLGEAPGGAMLKVGRFWEDPALDAGSPTPSWRLPLAVAPASGPVADVVVDGELALRQGGPDLLVNAGARSYARVDYSQARIDALLARYAAMRAADQLNLINDGWALGQAGYAPARNALKWVTALPATADPIVWRRVTGLLLEIDQDHPPGPARDAFRRFSLATLAPVAARLQDRAAAGEDPAATALRTSVRTARALLGDAAVISAAREAFASGAGDAEARRATLTIVGETADPATFEALLAKARATADPLERNRILLAMAQARDPALSVRMVDIALSPLAPSGTAPQLLGTAAQAEPDAVWPALVGHADDPNLPIDPLMRPDIFADVASGSADPQRAAQLEAWAEGHTPADARRPIAEAVSQIALNQRVRTHAIPDIDAWLADRSSRRAP